MPRIRTPADIAEFRNRLCDIGAQLFAEHGFEGFNMRELARRLGVSAMTPYRYFTDKEAIMSEVRVRAFGRFADWLEERLCGPDVDDNTLSRAYAQYAIQEQTQYRLMFDLVPRASTTLPALTAEGQRVRKVITAHLRALADRDLVSGDPELLSLILWSVLHGATALHLAGRLSNQDFDQALSQAERAFVLSTMDQAANLPTGNSADSRSAPWWQVKPRVSATACEAGI
jgi:AcrR family transcriptional regulator